MDFFEKRIKEQRSDLDHIEQVDEAKLWQQINAGLNAEPARKTMRFLKWYAAAASLLLLVSFGYFMYQQGQESTKQIVYVQESIELPPAIKQEEQNYKLAVADKQKELQLEKITKEDFQDIFSELKLLDEIHEEFRKELPQISDNEKIIKILKKYYERKLRILDRLTKEIEKKSRYEKRNLEKSL